jgi:hypothetical protein
MPHPAVIYELTPTLGMAVTAPDFQQVETTDDHVAFRITSKVYPVRREKAGDEWKPIPV